MLLHTLTFSAGRHVEHLLLIRLMASILFFLNKKKMIKKSSKVPKEKAKTFDLCFVFYPSSSNNKLYALDVVVVVIDESVLSD